jgi:YD repeat-containing protein
MADCQKPSAIHLSYQSKIIMKNILSKIIIYSTVGFSFLGFWACNNSTDNVVPLQECKLITETIAQTNQPQAGAGTIGTNANINLTNTYDSQGRLTQTVATTAGQNSNNTSPYTYNNTTNYTYDANGYLISRTDNINNVVPPNTVTSNTSISYQYANNRIVLSTAQTTSSVGNPTTKTTAYTYDASGSLTQIVEETMPSGLKYTFTYVNNILTAYAYRPSATTSETQPFTIVNGLVTRSSFIGTHYSNFVYDAQERLTRSETFANNVLSTYYTYEYDEMTPPKQAIPIFKGFPVVKNHYGKPGVSKRYEYYAVNSANSTTLLLLNRTTATNQANSRGMVTTSAEINNQYSSLSSNVLMHIVTNTKNYTYSDCQ